MIMIYSFTQEGGGKKKKGKKVKEEAKEVVKEEEKKSAPAPTVAKAKVKQFLINGNCTKRLLLGGG